MSHPGRFHGPQEISVVGCTKGDEPVGGRSAESFNPCPVSPLMVIARHKNARTTPAVRAEIAASADCAVALAQR